MRRHALLCPGWSKALYGANTVGVMVVGLNVGGRRYFFATTDFDCLETYGQTRWMHVTGALVDSPTMDDKCTPYEKQYSLRSFTVNVMERFFPYVDMRRLGMSVESYTADLYLYFANAGMAFNQAFFIMRGNVQSIERDEENGTVLLQVDEYILSGDSGLPEIVADRTRLTGLNPDQVGEYYPIVFGTVYKMPVLIIDNTNKDDFLVMHDKTNEFDTSTSQVANVYDGDGAAIAVAGQGQTADALSTDYYYATIAAGVTSNNATADVTGHTPDDIGEAIRFFFSFFGKDPWRFNMASANYVGVVLSALSYGIVVNDDVGSAMDLIRNRIVEAAPVVMTMLGDQFVFIPLRWDRQCKKVLSFDKNVLKVVEPPKETPRSNIYTSFVVTYTRSGLRNASQGTIVRDHTTSPECLAAYNRYGPNGMPKIDLGDLSDEDGAMYMINWFIETYTKARVMTSVMCTLDVVDVNRWDTVRFYNEHENWNHGPMFKVVNIRYSDGDVIKLDLLSHDDKLDVYDTNTPRP